MASLPNPCQNPVRGARGISVRRSWPESFRGVPRRASGLALGVVRYRTSPTAATAPPSARYSAPAPASQLSAFLTVGRPASLLTSASAAALARILQAPTTPHARKPRMGSDRGDGERDAQRQQGRSRPTRLAFLTMQGEPQRAVTDAQLAKTRSGPSVGETPVSLGSRDCSRRTPSTPSSSSRTGKPVP